MTTNIKNLSLSAKLVAAFVVVGLAPLVVVGLSTLRSISQLSKEAAQGLESTAQSISDKIDRNLFERYGDVQAFGVNEVISDKASWYQAGSASNKIAAAMNRYANLYGIYPLCLLVDLEGKVIAVNDKNPAGNSIDTTAFYGRNFKDESWFKDALAGNFLKSDILTGTVVQDLHIDEDLKKTYGSDGLAVTFSAPVKDAEGNVIAVWSNRADFSLVEEIFVAAYKDLKAQGLKSAELTLVDRAGRVLIDYDPTSNGDKEAVAHNADVLLKLNLAEKGVSAVKEVIKGKSGYGTALHTRKKIEQSAGYAPCDGALGYAGLKWGVLVRASESEALATVLSARNQQFWIIGGCAALLPFIGWRLGRSVAGQMQTRIAEINSVGEQVSAAAQQVNAASQSLAEGASEQAASLEETSASLEEMASMTNRNAESSHAAKDFTTQARTAAEAGATTSAHMTRSLERIKGSITELRGAMDGIRTASHEVSKIIKTIDEIAFQTNILALNAAVEAARAGEAGAGFAVVADEVRTLAQRSAKAARETAEKIEDSIRKSEAGEKASGLVTESLNEVAASGTKVDENLREILAKVRQVDETVAQIATASKEQSQGIEQINLAVSQMDKVTQSNAASAEESAAAASQLNSQASTLKDAVTQLLAVVQGGGHSSGASEETHTSPAAPAPREKKISASPTRALTPAKPARSAPAVASRAASRSAEQVITLRGGGEDFIPMPGDGSSPALPSDKDFRDF